MIRSHRIRIALLLLLLTGGVVWYFNQKMNAVIKVTDVNQEAKTANVLMKYKDGRIEGLRSLGAIHQFMTEGGHELTTSSKGNRLMFQIVDKEKGLVAEKEVIFN